MHPTLGKQTERTSKKNYIAPAIAHDVPSKLRSILSRAFRILTDDENSNYTVIMSVDGFITDSSIKIVYKHFEQTYRHVLSKIMFYIRY